MGLALRGAAEAEARRLRADQGIAYSQAHLMGYAFHAPRKTPRIDRVFPDPMRRLIAALATQAANDYLQAQAAENQAEAADRPNPVPLPAEKQAA